MAAADARRLLPGPPSGVAADGGGIEAQTARGVEMIGLLLANRAEVSARSHDGLTACAYAEPASDTFSQKIQTLVCP